MSIKPYPLVPLNVISAGYPRDPRYFVPRASGEFCLMNCWWQYALVDPKCIILANDNGMLKFDCPCMAGNSGSPLIRKSYVAHHGSFELQYSIVGVIEGYSDNIGNCEITTSKACDIGRVNSDCPSGERCLVPCRPWRFNYNAGPGAERFQYAPRHATHVAIAGHTDDSARTQLFSTDDDPGLIVTRYRKGTDINDGFTNFSKVTDLPSPKRIAAFNHKNGDTEVMVATAAGDLYAKRFAAGNLGAWVKVKPPGQTGGVIDVHALYDLKNTDQYFIVADNGKAYYKRPNKIWSFLYPWTQDPWVQIPSGPYSFNRIAAVRKADGAVQVFMLTSYGSIMTQTLIDQNPWTFPEAFWEGDQLLPPIVDVDAALDYDQRLRVFAVDETGKLWLRTMTAPGDWGPWEEWVTNLHAPWFSLPQPPPQNIRSLTAGHWQEENLESKTWGVFPVVFATDEYGNVYYTAEHRYCSPSDSGECTWDSIWDDWRSFYD